MQTLRFLLALVVCAAAVRAQTPPGLRVRVQDPSGAVIHGATVRVRPASGPAIAAATNEAGEAEFSSMAPGKAQVTVEAVGFTTQQLTTHLRAGRTQHLTPTLAIATRQEEVQVALDAQEEAADPRGNSFSTVLTPRQIEQLPDDPDEMEKVLRQMAGPGATMRIDGFRGGRLPHKSEIQSIRFRLTPYSAEEHDDGFALVDIQTKPGLGLWHASANFAYGGDTFNARNFFAPMTEPQQLKRYDFSLSGPLRRNKTSLSLSLTRNNSYDSRANVGVLPTGPFSNLLLLPSDALNASGRLQHALSRSHALRLEYQYAGAEKSNANAFDLPERLWSSRSDSHLLRVSDFGPLTERLVNEVRFQSQWTTAHSLSASDAPSIIVQSAFNAGGAGVGNERRARSLEITDHLSFNIGKHGLRTGIQVEGGSYFDRDRSNLNGTFTFASVADYLAGRPLLYRQRVGTNPVNYSQYQFGGYLQDDYRWRKNLSLSLGLRYETQTGMRDRMNLAPRMGLTWSPFKSGKTTVRAGGGLFYDWFGADLYAETLRVNGSVQSDLFVTSPSYPDPFANGGSSGVLPGSIIRLDPSLQLPYVIRASAGIQQQLFGRFMMMTDVRWQRGVHLLRGRNLNAPVPGQGRPEPSLGNVLQLESSALSTNRAWMIGIGPAPSPKAFNSRTFWFANYMLSSTVDETNSPLDLPMNSFNPRADRGPALTDARHRVSLMSNVTLFPGWTLGTFLRASSATPYNITTGFDNNGDTAINDRPAGVGRNSARGIAQVEMSTRLSWSRGFGEPRRDPSGPTPRLVRIGDGGGSGVPDLPGGRTKPARYSLQFYAQAYNVTNHGNLQGFIGVQTSPLFGQPTLALAGRRIELGTKFSF